MGERRLGLVVCLSVLGFGGACYSALDPAGSSSSQYADNADAVEGTVFVPLPAQAWEGINLVPHDANSLCIDGVVASGTSVTLQACAGSVLQRFKWHEGLLELAGGRCLDLDNSAGTPQVGTAAKLSACDGNSPTQLWTYGNGWIYPEVIGRTAPPSLCLSTVTNVAYVGRSFELAACTAPPIAWDIRLNNGQGWVGFSISSSLNANYCMVDPNDATAEGAPVTTASCTGATSQKFSMRQGFLEVDGVTLNVQGDVGVNNSVIALNGIVPGAESELFAFEHGRIYTYSGPNASRCVEIPGANPSAGKQLDVYDCTANSNLTVAPQMHWVFGYDVR